MPLTAIGDRVYRAIDHNTVQWSAIRTIGPARRQTGPARYTARINASLLVVNRETDCFPANRLISS